MDLFLQCPDGAGNSLIGSSHLITKVYFPRLLVPTAIVIAGLADYAVASVLLVPLMLWNHMVPPLTALATVPLLTLLVAALALGTGLWMSALTVKYRDFTHLAPFLVQIWMYASPVIWPLSKVPGGTAGSPS